ncbi:hypothetical protein D3C81_2108620 [compost metagenome]
MSPPRGSIARLSTSVFTWISWLLAAAGCSAGRVEVALCAVGTSVLAAEGTEVSGRPWALLLIVAVCAGSSGWP